MTKRLYTILRSDFPLVQLVKHIQVYDPLGIRFIADVPRCFKYDTINQIKSINHKSLCIAILQGWNCYITQFDSLDERSDDLDTIVWRAMCWGADGMTSTTELTSSPLVVRSRCVEQQPTKPGYRRYREPDGRHHKAIGAGRTQCPPAL